MAARPQPCLPLDPALLRDATALVQRIEDLETQRHGTAVASPFLRRYGADLLHRVDADPRVLAQLYSQSFCNVGQVNASHAGDCARRRVVAAPQPQHLGQGVELVPYTARHVPAVCAWFAADEDLQDTFGVSGDAKEGRALQAADARSREQQTFLIVRRAAVAAIDGGDSCDSAPCAPPELLGQIRLRLPAGPDETVPADETGGGRGVGDTQPSLTAHVAIPEAEVELLIGDTAARRRGVGRAALRLLGQYAHFVHCCDAFAAVVEECNDAAMGFFRGVGFAEASRDDASETVRFELRGAAFQAMLRAPQVRGGPSCEPCGGGGPPRLCVEAGPGNGTPPDSRAVRMQRLKCTRVEGDRILLVPYQRDHVREYHAWMQDPHILEMTASEPLSLAAEFAMLHEWHDDPAKLTFIITDRAETEGTEAGSGSELVGMAGDVNLFFNDPDDPAAAEIDVMVAATRHRRCGFATEAVRLMMRVAARSLGVRTVRAKIKMDNAPSRALFTQLGFVEEARLEVFNEVHLVKALGGEGEGQGLEEREGEGEGGREAARP